MPKRGRYPQTDCPTCRRRVGAGPSSQRLMPHDDPGTGVQCAGAGQQVDLYGVDPDGDQ